ILRHGSVEKELAGGEPGTTNNRMELMAAIMGLEALKRPCKVRLYTDSQYLRDGITQWLPAWKARGWRTAAKAPVKNVDLWQRLEQATEPHQIEWHWVRGHAGHPENERADAPLSRCNAARISAGRTARGDMDCRISSIICALEPRCGRREAERLPVPLARRGEAAPRAGRSAAAFEGGRPRRPRRPRAAGAL